MADEVERSAEDWQDLLGKMFPELVVVTGTADDAPQYTAEPSRVFFDPDSKKTLWVLGISESHAEYVDLAGATVQPNGTLRVNAFGSTASVRGTTFN